MLCRSRFDWRSKIEYTMIIIKQLRQLKKVLVELFADEADV